MTLDEKYTLALEARSHSYSPYSNFKVGALLIFKDGSYVKGCNVENASYGLSNCAERTAVFRSIAEGKDMHECAEVVIIADSKRPVSPCGACRQVLAEFMAKDAKVTLFNLEKEVLETTIGELIPYCFDEGDMNDK